MRFRWTRSLKSGWSSPILAGAWLAVCLGIACSPGNAQRRDGAPTADTPVIQKARQIAKQWGWRAGAHHLESQLLSGSADIAVQRELLHLYQSHATDQDWQLLGERLASLTHPGVSELRDQIPVLRKEAQEREARKADEARAEQENLRRRLTNHLVTAARKAPEVRSDAQKQQDEAMRQRRNQLSTPKNTDKPWWSVDTPGRAWVAFVALLCLVGLFQVLKLFRRNRRIFGDS